MHELEAYIVDKYLRYKDKLLLAFLTELYDDDIKELLIDLAKLLSMQPNVSCKKEERRRLLACLWMTLVKFYGDDLSGVFNVLQEKIGNIWEDEDIVDYLPFN